MLRINEITITDTFGIKHQRFAPGTVTRITGGNGQGKSSILRAVSFLFEGGSDPSVIRKGALKSVIELKMNDGVTITKTTAPTKPRKARKEDPDPPVKYDTRLEILDADETPMPAPQSYINALSAAMAVDPNVLLRIDTTTVPGRKQLADTLIKLVPISFGPEDVGAAIAYRSSSDLTAPDSIALPVSPEREINLDELKKSATSITEQRRRVGQTRDESSGAVARLKKALPADGQDGARLTVELAEAEDYRRVLDKSIADQKLDTEQQKAAAIGEANLQFSEAEKEINAYIETKMRTLEAERNERLNAKRSDLGIKLSKIQEVTREWYETLAIESAPESERVIGIIAKLKEQVAAFHRASTLRDEIETQLATCRAANWKYDELSGVLQRIEALRLEKLSGLPVRGLVVEEGTAYLDGVEWQNVNTARRVEAVLEICTQQTGKLPFVILDDCEHLDAETRNAVEQGLANAGYQLITASVSDGPLSIETLEIGTTA